MTYFSSTLYKDNKEANFWNRFSKVSNITIYELGKSKFIIKEIPHMIKSTLSKLQIKMWKHTCFLIK